MEDQNINVETRKLKFLRKKMLALCLSGTLYIYGFDVASDSSGFRDKGKEIRAVRNQIASLYDQLHNYSLKSKNNPGYIDSVLAKLDEVTLLIPKERSLESQIDSLYKEVIWSWVYFVK